MHAPLIVKAPGIDGGKKTAGLTEFIDIYPSLCELAGLPLPPHLQGRSFVPLMEQPNRPWKDAAIGRFGSGDISWFAHQGEAYRNKWLRYAWGWVRQHDPNGFFQMPGSRILHAPVGGQHWYCANTRSEASPQGFSQEETIKAIWSEDRRP